MGLKRAGELTVPKLSSSQLPWSFNFKKDVGLGVDAYFVALHDLTALWPTSDNEADNGDIPIHFVTGQMKPPICDHIYYDEDDPKSNCDFCKMPGYQNKGLNNNFLIKPLVVLCLNLIDSKRTDEETEKEYDCNPLKILMVRYKKNFGIIEDRHQHGALSIFDDKQAVFTMKQEKKANGDAGKISEPKFLSDYDLKGLGKQFKTKLAEFPENVVAQFNPKTIKDGVVKGLILEQLGNVKRDSVIWTEDVKVIWPVEEVVEKDTESDKDSPADNTLDK